MKKNLKISIFILRLYQVAVLFFCSLICCLPFVKSTLLHAFIDAVNIQTNEQTTVQLLFWALSFGAGGFILLLALEQLVLILKNFQSLKLFEQINSTRFKQAGQLFFILSIIIALFPIFNGLLNHQLVFAIRFDGALLTCLIGTILIILSNVFTKAKEIDTENKMTI